MSYLVSSGCHFLFERLLTHAFCPSTSQKMKWFYTKTQHKPMTRIMSLCINMCCNLCFWFSFFFFLNLLPLVGSFNFPFSFSILMIQTVNLCCLWLLSHRDLHFAPLPAFPEQPPLGVTPGLHHTWRTEAQWNNVAAIRPENLSRIMSI